MEEPKDVMNCLFCGAPLVWEDNTDCSNFGDYDDDDTAVISSLHCPKCGRSYEIWDPPQEKRENEYKEYWEGQ